MSKYLENQSSSIVKYYYYHYYVLITLYQKNGNQIYRKAAFLENNEANSNDSQVSFIFETLSKVSIHKKIDKTRRFHRNFSTESHSKNENILFER